MKKIDFLSLTPSNKLSIFNRNRNKTSIGGFMFIIEMVAIFLITFIYLFDHFNTAPYNIQSNNIFQTDIDVYDTKLLDERFDQEINFTFNLKNDYGNEVSDNFLVTTYSDIYPLSIHTGDLRKTYITKKPSQSKLAIFYKCHNDTVCKYFERGKRDKDYTNQFYEFQIHYPGFEIKHQGMIPLRGFGEIKAKCPFLFETVTSTKFHWKNIKYEEESGMWSRFFNNYLLGKEIISYVKGYIESFNTIPLEIEEDRVYTFGREYKLLSVIAIENKIYNYLNYKRTANSIFTTIANISALISTVNFLLIKILSYYSNNFDNYKIIRYVSNKRNISVNNLIRNSEKSKEMKEINIKEETNAPLINEENEMYNQEKGNDIQEEVDKNHEKINFMQFFLNNLYCHCCKKRKTQEIIKICNEIISKYLSVENLLYNQIILENFWRDYKWNNPDQNGLKYNELFLKFNNLI